MKQNLLLGTVAAAMIFAGLPGAVPQDSLSDTPRFQSGNRLVRPEGYREWIYLSSGLGMAYSPAPGEPEMFTNVFVPQFAYQKFLASGRWPDKTVFVLEERSASSKGSINRAGHFQTDLMGISVALKDETRFPEKWAYFSFGQDKKTAAANPKAACWQCHNAHAAVENTFVQFYPTLKPVALKFGTYQQREGNTGQNHSR